jgi:sec-independent protein translocase protein TatC
MLSLMMGILFEIPIVAYFLAKLGLIDRQLLTDYRKHAFIVLCILAAIITPTADIFTLLLVTLPLYLLYEISIHIVAHTKTNNSD